MRGPGAAFNLRVDARAAAREAGGLTGTMPARGVAAALVCAGCVATPTTPPPTEPAVAAAPVAAPGVPDADPAPTRTRADDPEDTEPQYLAPPPCVRGWVPFPVAGTIGTPGDTVLVDPKTRTVTTGAGGTMFFVPYPLVLDGPAHMPASERTLTVYVRVSCAPAGDGRLQLSVCSDHPDLGSPPEPGRRFEGDITPSITDADGTCQWAAK